MSIKNRHEYLHFCELIDTHDTISHPIQYSLPKRKGNFNVEEKLSMINNLKII